MLIKAGGGLDSFFSLADADAELVSIFVWLDDHDHVGSTLACVAAAFAVGWKNWLWVTLVEDRPFVQAISPDHGLGRG